MLELNWTIVRHARHTIRILPNSMTSAMLHFAYYQESLNPPKHLNMGYLPL